MNRKAASGMMLTLLLIGMLALAFNIQPVKAEPTRVYVDFYGSPNVFDTCLTPGKQFSINITVDYVEELWAYQIEMSFNPDIIHGISYEDGEFLGSADGDVFWFSGRGFDNEKGKLDLFGACLYLIEKFPTGGGTLAIVTFEVVGIGGSPLTLGPGTGLLNRTGGWELGPDWEPLRKFLNPNVFIDGYFDNRPPVYVDPSEVRNVPIGESFTVDVNIANITDLYSWSFYLDWNASLLDVTDITEGDFLKSQPEGTSFAYEIHNEEGYLYIECTTMGDHPGVSGSGTLTSVTFLVEEEGSSLLHMHDISLLDPNSNRLSHATGDGWFNNVRIHDIAIIRVKPFPTTVKPGQLVTINVTVSNRGDFSEIFNVTAYYDDNPIDEQTHISLENKTAITLTFTLNTTGFDRGKYVIKAVASTVINETDTADNTYTDGTVTVTGTIYVDASNVGDPLEDGSLEHPFDRIQEGINAAYVGDTVYVYNGTYYENVVVDKAVSLMGESRDAVIYGGVFVRADNAIVRNFTIQNGDVAVADSSPRWVMDVIVQGNTLVNGGIDITGSWGAEWPLCNNTIAENHITNATEGISVRWSRGNRIIGNTLIGNDVGILLDGDNTTVLDNHVEGGGVGMHLNSRNNVLADNSLDNNIYNFGFGRSGPYSNNIDTSNTINDRRIYFVVNQSNILVDPISCPNAGYLALVDCKNVTAKDFDLSGNGQGVLLQGGERNALLNNTLVNNVVGLQVLFSDRNKLIDNTVSDNGIGMWLLGSSLNTIVNNKFRNNTRCVLNNLSQRAQILYGSLRYSYGWASGALNLYGSSSNLIVGNNMIDSDVGMFIYYSSNNTLRNNAMTDNLLNFGVDPSHIFSRFEHDIDDSNTVNGKPVIYWVNEHGKQVPENAGYAAIINSSDITIKNLEISNNMPGILIVSSNNSLVSGNKIADCPSGIIIRQTVDAIPPSRSYSSTNITVYNNTAVGCGVGISLYVGGEGHTVSRNDFSDNLAGIYVNYAEHTTISGNTVTNCTDWGYDKIPHEMWWWYSPIPYVGCVGICIEASNNTVVGNTIGYNDIGMALGARTRRGNNKIYHNNFINNTYQLWIASLNVWDNGYPSGGNYWSDYTDVDLYSGPYQNETGSDGIGDTPYALCKWVDPSVPLEHRLQQDSYPLMSPYEYWSDPIPGDINKDMKVDYKDLHQLEASYGSTPEKPNWNPNADINNDGRVDHRDLFILAANYGEKWEYP